MAQIKVKQVAGLQATISALAGIDNIVETFTTNQTDGATGILITYSARERDAVQVYVNGQRVQEGYSWQKGGNTITADALEASTELVWDASTAGFSLDPTDEVQLQYETEGSGSVGTGSQPSTSYDDSAVVASIESLETAVSAADTATYLNGNIDTHLLPDSNEQYDLGGPENKFRYLYLSANSLYLGDTHIQLNNNKLELPGIRIGNEFDITTEEQLAQTVQGAEANRISTLYQNKIRHATSPVWLVKPEGQYVGSGQWVTLDQDVDGNPTDLDEGWFLTCAHNIFKVDDAGEHSFYSPVYISLNNEWYQVDPSQYHYDAVADIALIRTGLSLQADKVLKLSRTQPQTGQPVWMVGFPAGLDNDSMTHGVIRDAHFNITDGGQAVDSLFLNAPGIGGNSGSAILDSAGDIIGIFTFGYSSYETFGGGANLQVLEHVIGKLKQQPAGPYRAKLYLGIDWARIGPHDFQAYLPVTDGIGGPALYTRALQQGCRVTAVAADSALNGIIEPGDILLGVQPLGTGGSYQFGYTGEQRTPGIMIYQEQESQHQIEWIQQGTNARLQQIITFTTYNNTTADKDNYLQGGTNRQANQARVQD